MQALAGCLSGTSCHVSTPQIQGARRLTPDASFRHGAASIKHRSQYPQARRDQFAQHVCCAAAPPAAEPPGAKKGGFAVDVNVEALPKSRLKLTVTVPASAVKRAYDGGLKSFRKVTKIPGFRSGGGKVPDEMLLRYVDGGDDSLKRAAIEQLMETSLPHALKKYQGNAISESLTISSPLEELVEQFDVERPLTYTVNIDLAPTVGWAKPYKDIKVEVEAASDEESDRAAVERMLNSLRKEKGTLRVVTGRGLQQGDVAITAFDCTRNDTGEAIQGAKQQAMRLDTETADREFIPGLASGMLGMSAGDERSVPVTFPPTWVPEQLRGIQATCSVNVSEIFEWELPELTDEFIKENLKSCNDVAGARQELLEAQQLQSAETTQHNITEALSEAVADAVEADVPESLVRSIGEQEYQAELIRMQTEKKVSLDVVRQLASPEMLANYIDHKRERLEEMNRAVLGFEEIFRAEGLIASEEEVSKEFEKGAKDFRDEGAEFDEERLQEQAVETVRAVKVLEWLQKNITIDVKPYAGGASA